MAGRVTIQNIADALGISRNTVSKAINNTGVLAESTRQKVLNKAREMGYKQFSYLSLPESGAEGAKVAPADSDSAVIPPGGGAIALLTTMFLTPSHFGSTMLDKIQRELSLLNYTLTIHLVTADNLKQKSLPASFSPSSADGVICMELFDSAYSHMLCGLSLPILFIDYPTDLLIEPFSADRLLMSNRHNIRLLIYGLMERGCRRFGFIGDFLHCMSFYERFTAFREACFMLKLDADDMYSITGNQTDRTDFSSYNNYHSYLKGHLASMKKLPDAFICANDFVACDSMQVLKELGVRIPEDVMITGFDDSPESRIITPALTTVHIHSQIMGFSAVQMLLSRIREPSLHYRIMYTETSLIWRESTGPCTPQDGQ